MNSTLFRTIVAAGALTLIAGPAGAEPPATTSQVAAKSETAMDPVVARVNGVEIHLSEVELARQALPPKYRMSPMKVIFPKLLPGLINAQLVADAARAAGVDQQEQVKRNIAAEERRILAGAYFDKIASEKITEKALTEEYRAYALSEGSKEKARARHILVPTEKEAKEIIKELESGADFAELARKKSKGPSGPKGGDLGFFEHDRMVKPFADAAFALKKGEFTHVPVKTRFGWHVIKLEEKRRLPVPSFQKSRLMIVGRLRSKIASEFMNKLKKNAEIETFNMDGSPKTPPQAKAGPGGKGSGSTVK